MTRTGLIPVPGSPGMFYTGGLSESAGGFFVADEVTTSRVAFSWGGIEFSTASPFKPRRVSGWDGPPDGDAPDEPLAGRHGSRVTRITRRRRTVEIEGSCTTRGARDQLFQMLGDALSAGFGDGGETAPLVGSVAGRELTADAQLLRFQPTIETRPWGMGVWTWALQFICPDPLRYGPQVLYSAGISNSTSGITFPVTPPWVFPAAPLSGQMAVSNPGNTAAAAVFTLNGPLTAIGLDVAGQRVTYGFPLGIGDSLVIDTAQGGAFLNGEYRSPAPGSARTQQLMIPRGVSTVQALGSAGPGGTPWVTASFRPAYW